MAGRFLTFTGQIPLMRFVGKLQYKDKLHTTFKPGTSITHIIAIIVIMHIIAITVIIHFMHIIHIICIILLILCCVCSICMRMSALNPEIGCQLGGFLCMMKALKNEQVRVDGNILVSHCYL